MRAFHGDESIKAKYLLRVRTHRAADDLQHGYYWENGKGCAVGCTIHSRHHAAYETELGIPCVLARLEDHFFEGMSNEKAQAWPEAFLSAISVDADLSHVVDHFMLWVLVDEQDGAIRFASRRGKTTIEEVAALYRRKLAGEIIQKDEWWSAWRSADAEVAEAAEAAEEAASEAVAAYAAEAAHAEDTEATAKAAYAAEAAAAAVEAAAATVDDDAEAAAAVRKDFYGRMADKLLELLAAAPVIDAASLRFASNPTHM